MQNARLDEAQTGIEMDRRNINNLKYADDTTLMAESREELKSLFMKVKEQNERAGLKLNIQKIKIVPSGPITSQQINGEKMETVIQFIFLGCRITAEDDCSLVIQRWVYLYFSPLCFTSLLFPVIYKASYNNYFAFLFLGDGFDHCLLYNIMNLHP